MKKYRPYFNLQELKYILEAIQKQSQVSSLSLYISNYIEDIERKKIQASITLEPRKDKMMTNLGFKEEPKCIRTPWEQEQQNRFETDQMTPAEEQDWVNYCMKNGI